MSSFPSREKVTAIREMYPIGCRVELISMTDDPRPIPSGTQGYVRIIDDIGTVHVSWDNGSTLGVALGKDKIRKLVVNE